MAADMLTRGGGRGGQNFGKSSYVILEHSLNNVLQSIMGLRFDKFNYEYKLAVLKWTSKPNQLTTCLLTASFVSNMTSNNERNDQI